MRELQRVTDLLAELFSLEELRILLAGSRELEDLRMIVAWEAPAFTVFSEIASAIERRALWKEAFTAMVQARPARAERIAAVAADMGTPIRVGELRVELERKQLEAVAHLEARAADFVAKSKADLESRERNFRRAAYSCYFAGGMALLGGSAFAVWRAVAAQSNGLGSADWASVAELAVLGIVAITLVIAVARYCFILGRAFMVEAVRNADRSHAISFGEFYLRAYGQSAQWMEVKEAFQHWNIGESSSFVEQKPEGFDPQVLALAMEMAKLLVAKEEKKSNRS